MMQRYFLFTFVFVLAAAQNNWNELTVTGIYDSTPQTPTRHSHSVILFPTYDKDDLTQIVNPTNNNNRDLENHFLVYGGQINLNSGTTDFVHDFEVRNNGNTATYFNVNDTFASLTPLARYGHSAVNAGNNLMLVFGGNTGSPVNELWGFDYLSNVWFPINAQGTPPSPREFHTAVMIGTKMWIYGGRNGNAIYGDVYAYDVGSNTWTQIPTTTPSPGGKVGHSAVAYYSTGFIVFAGQSGTSRLTNDVWLFDVNTLTWEEQKINTSISFPPQERYEHTAVLVRGGRYMVIFGGLAGQYRNDLWIYDVQCKIWTQMNPGGNRPQARSRHSAIAYKDTEMYIFGGRDVTTSFRTMHRYTVPVAPAYGYCPIQTKNVLDNDASALTVFATLIIALAFLM